MTLPDHRKQASDALTAASNRSAEIAKMVLTERSKAMTTYTMTKEQRETLIDALEKADSEVVPSGVLGSETEQAIESAIALLEALQPNTQEHRADTVFGGPKAREQMLNQLVHPAPKDSDEPRLSDLFCGVDVTEGMLSVSVLRRRSDDVAEVLHSEQFELPQTKPLTDEQIFRISENSNVPYKQPYFEVNRFTDVEEMLYRDSSIFSPLKFARAIEAAHNIGVKP